VTKAIAPTSAPWSRRTALRPLRRGEKRALAGAEKRGCCSSSQGRLHAVHRGPNFSDDKFHRIGLADPSGSRSLRGEPEEEDRWRVSNAEPAQRRLTAPYMPTARSRLEAVVEFYDRGRRAKAALRTDLPLELEHAEKRDLVRS